MTESIILFPDNSQFYLFIRYFSSSFSYLIILVEFHICLLASLSTPIYLFLVVSTFVRELKSSHSVRREQVILTHLRIGRCQMSHGFLLQREPPPICQRCAVLLTVEDIFLECPDFNASQERYNLEHLLQTVLGDNVNNLCQLFLFLQATGLYDQI